MIKKIIILIFLFPNLVTAQIPSYYSTIDFTKTGDSLKTQLTTLVSTTHTYWLDYTSSINIDTWDAIKQSDLKDNDTSNVLLVYGYNDLDTITKNDRLRDKTLSCHTSSCAGLWNREHVFPQSKANPSMDTQFPGTGTDAHNLRAADAQMNGTRSNRSYDSSAGNAGLIGSNFYPGDEWRGDVARIIMYMYVRYPSQCEPINVAIGSTSYSIHGDMPNILLEWNAQDTVSQYEKNRNDIFFTIQGNRNPFIDNPYLATRIWNGPSAPNRWNVPLTIKELEPNHLKVYPNISRGPITIEDDKQILQHISVYTIYGQSVPFEQIHNGIDLSNQAEGIYVIRLSTKNGSKTSHKVVLDK